MTEFNCPNCGSGTSPRLATIRMMNCPSCGTTLLLGGDVVEMAGEQGVMHDAPQLFGVGDTIVINGAEVEILGHARYSYGRGFWDEFWGLVSGTHSTWVSVDEGDIVMQQPLARGDWPTIVGQLKTGATLTAIGNEYDVVEMEEAECVALRGAFDEDLKVGETYRFVNAQGAHQGLLSGEMWEGGESWYLGEWADPFEVEVRRAFA